MDTYVFVGLISLAFLLLVELGLLLFLFLRKPTGAGALLGPLQNLTSSIGGVQIEVRGLAERLATVERSQAQVGLEVAGVTTRLAETGTVTQGLSETASAIRAGLVSAQENLSALRAQAGARQDLEQRTADSVRRLEAIIAGTQTKGNAGENILELVFAQLPAEWQVRDFQVGNKVVEFGLRLPNNLVLPIDSKWTATNLVEQFAAAEDVEEQQRLKAQIERAVLAKAREVRKYIDPSTTVDFGIAAVPDAVYDLCAGIQGEVLSLSVVLVSYSMFVPYLLLVFQTVLKTSRDIDLEKLHAYLARTQESIRGLQEEVEGRLSKALVMLDNSREEMRARLGRAAAGLAAIQIGSDRAKVDESPQEPGASEG